MLTISSLTEDAAIYYTTDGSDPTENSIPYTAPIPFMQNDTVRAVAICDGYDNSAVSVFMKDDFKVSTPEATISDDYVVTLTCPDIPEDVDGFPETQIYYTVNSSSWQWNYNNSEWQLYDGPIQLTDAGYVHVVAKRDGWNDSNQQNFNYYDDYVKESVTFTVDNIQYTNKREALFTDEVSVTGHSLEGEAGTIDLVIPDSVTYEGVSYAVTSINRHAFSSCSSLSSVTIPSSVTTIGDYAFMSCSSLSSVTIPSSVTSFNNTVFSNCSSLNDVKIVVTDYSEYCNNIVARQFRCPVQLIDNEGYGIYKFVIPGDVTTIGEYAFNNCTGLSSVTLPNSLTTIGDRAFQGCTGLTSITIPNSVTSIGGYSFYGCSNLASVNKGRNVGSIGEYAFSSCTSLTSIALPDILESIGAGAFQSSGLTSVNIPGSVKTIGDNAFYGCSSLASVSLEEGLTSIGSSAFRGCALTSVTTPNSVETIGGWAFADNVSLTTAVLGDGITEVAERMFWNCGALTSVHIPDGVTSIGTNAFAVCRSLASVKLPETLTSLGGDVFNYTALKSIELPDAFTAIPENLFNYIDFQYIKLGNNVKSIGKNAFGSSNPVIEIGTATPPTIVKEAFPNVEFLADLNVIVPDAKAETAYKKAAVWGEMTYSNLGNVAEVTVETPGELSFELILQTGISVPKVVGLKVNGTINADDFTQMLVNMKSLLRLDLSDCDITEIPDEALMGKTQLQELILPTKLQTIGKSAFQNCPYLSGPLSLPTTLTTIGESAFVGTAYTSVTLPATLQTIGDRAFYNLPISQRLVLPGRLNSVGAWAFAGTKISGLVIPDGVTSIGDYAFYQTPIEGHVTIPDGVTYLGMGAFKNTPLSTVFLPNSVTTLSEELFQGCKNLDFVYVPDNFTNVASSAFDGCGSLQILRLSASLTTMGRYAFQNTPLDYLKVPSQVEVLSQGVLKNCNKLTSLSLPAGLTTVESEALMGCTALRNLSVEALTPPVIKDRSAIRGINTDLCLISIPTSSYRQYILAEYWGQFVQMRNDIAVETEGNGEIAFENVLDDEDEEDIEESRMRARRSAAARAAGRAPQLATEEESMTFANSGSSVYVPQQGQVRFYIIPGEGEELLSATLDGEDIMPYIVNGVYTATADKKNAKLLVNFSGVGKDVPSITYDLAEGWNWISTNLDSDEQRNSTTFINGIDELVARLLGQTEELVKDSSYGLVGNLSTLSPTAGYKLNLSAATIMTKVGKSADILTPIHLYAGWNWLGYVPTEAQTIETALSALKAADGDRLLCEDDFAEYGDGAWQGSFDTMKPGKGYMYYSASDVDFSYTSAPVSSARGQNVPQLEATQEQAPWQYDVHAYPDNATVIARLLLDDMPVEPSNYALGAFCGDECRGVAKEVGDKLFITIHGTVGQDEIITLRAFDVELGQELAVAEYFTFQGQRLGSLDAPFELHLGSVVSAVESVSARGGDARIFDVNGRERTQLQPGVNIIVQADGTVRKVMVK